MMCHEEVLSIDQLDSTLEVLSIDVEEWLRNAEQQHFQLGIQTHLHQAHMQLPGEQQDCFRISCNV
jgi:hypothetical protein